MLRSVSTALCVVTLVAATGCVRVTHPLSEVGKAVTDDELVGVWELQDPIFGPKKDDHLRIEAMGDGRYRFSDSEEDATKEAVVIKSVAAAGANYFEIESCILDGADDKLMKSLLSFPVRWERKGDWIAVGVVNANVVERFVSEGKELSGKSKSESWLPDVTVTASAEELERFLSKHADEVYKSRSIYRKVTSSQTSPASAAAGNSR